MPAQSRRCQSRTFSGRSEHRFPFLLRRLRFLMYANPLFYIVRAYRQVLLSMQMPAWENILLAGAYGLAAFFLGGLVFRHLKRGFADVL